MNIVESARRIVGKQPARTAVRESNFDWLRLFLAGSVVYFHAGFWSVGVNKQDVPFGFIAFPMVPTFLALSGFLMFESFARSDSWGHFLFKRALRILPAVCVAIVLSGLVWGLREGVVGSIKTYLGGGILIPGAGGDFSLWSLLWEEIAYLTMALLIAVKAYERPRTIWIALLGACLVAAIYDQQEPLWRITNLAPGLFVGNLCYLYRAVIRRLPWLWVLSVVVVLTAVNRIGGFQAQAWYMVPVGCFLALSLCMTAPSLPRLPFDISYGLYVFHDPIWALATRWAPQSFASVWFTGAPLLIVLAIGSWFLIEKPFLKLKNRKIDFSALRRFPLRR